MVDGKFLENSSLSLFCVISSSYLRSCCRQSLDLDTTDDDRVPGRSVVAATTTYLRSLVFVMEKFFAPSFSYISREKKKMRNEEEEGTKEGTSHSLPLLSNFFSSRDLTIIVEKYTPLSRGVNICLYASAPRRISRVRRAAAAGKTPRGTAAAAAGNAIT